MKIIKFADESFLYNMYLTVLRNIYDIVDNRSVKSHDINYAKIIIEHKSLLKWTITISDK
jgi:hypothetical protein